MSTTSSKIGISSLMPLKIMELVPRGGMRYSKPSGRRVDREWSLLSVYVNVAEFYFLREGERVGLRWRRCKAVRV